MTDEAPGPPQSLPESVDAVVAMLAAQDYICDRGLATARTFPFCV